MPVKFENEHYCLELSLCKKFHGDETLRVLQNMIHSSINNFAGEPLQLKNRTYSFDILEILDVVQQRVSQISFFLMTGTDLIGFQQLFSVPLRKILGTAFSQILLT